MQTKISLVIGNWKMNPTSLATAKELFVTVRKRAKSFGEVEVVIVPPAVFLCDMARLSPSGRIAIGSQNIWPKPEGAQTGEISVPMVASCGARFVLIGHSERRAVGVTDELVTQKLQAVLQHKLTPVLCVGEAKRDSDGAFFSVVEQQLSSAFYGCKKSDVVRTVIAYEPVWAIGSGSTPTAEEIYEIRLFIEKCLTKQFDRATAQKVRILYGGSITEKNAAELYQTAGVDGFLVGGASLRAEAFVGIIQAVR